MECLYSLSMKYPYNLYSLSKRDICIQSTKYMYALSDITDNIWSKICNLIRGHLISFNVILIQSVIITGFCVNKGNLNT